MSILKRTVPAVLLTATLILPASAQDNSRIPGHVVFAEDGARKSADGPITFAVIGNTRGSLRALNARGAVSGISQSLLADLTEHVGPSGGPSFLVMMGDHVRTGSTLEWRRFDRRFSDLLAGESLEGDVGLPSVAVAGDRESLGDERLANWSSAFPGIGADIGFNRTASWYHFDLASQGHTWRIVILDSNKDRLGSRWTEQLAWLSDALYGRYDSLLIFMHDPVLDLSESEMNDGGGPLELIELIEDESSLRKIRAIIGAGSHANQVLLPDGPYGSLYLNAGGGGAPAQDLRRWGQAEEADRREDIHLEPMYDLALQGALTRWSEANSVPDVVLDEARATGSFEGFVGSISAKHMPTYGWWSMTLEGGEAALKFRHYLPDGVIEDRYQIQYTDDGGWKGRGL